jgi:hypothetical protein
MYELGSVGNLYSISVVCPQLFVVYLVKIQNNASNARDTNNTVSCNKARADRTNQPTGEKVSNENKIAVMIFLQKPNSRPFNSVSQLIINR